MAEILAEAWHEIYANPVTFALEFVQFAILLWIIKAIAIRFRGKPGMLVNMLTNYRERIRAALQDAESAEEELAAARQVAAERLAAARAQARGSVSEARRAAEEDARRVLEALDEELAKVRSEAEETLAKERAEMLSGVNEQLVDLVTQATRQVLDEGYTPAEQRALIQKSVMESLDELESVSLR